MHTNIFTFIAIALFIAACDSHPDRSLLAQQAKQYSPQDPHLKQIYQSSCKNCHTLKDTGAPLTGDTSTWHDLLNQYGKDLLLQNIINGKGGMPPFGLCMECQEQDFVALIDFMAQPMGVAE
ncbi:c-type cytochrome [Bermanella marisrubri]|nr:c-type cytochrome [Bermanella marisrubri]